MELPGTADLHPVLPVAGRAALETRSGGREIRDQPVLRRYRGDGSMRSVQIHIPRGTVDSVAARLGGRAVDFEAMAASPASGDPLVEEAVRAVGFRDGAGRDAGNRAAVERRPAPLDTP
ncbi:hypothetical protein ACSNOI_19330 [Actinomadura kijaniata]|uniref:hypothetical protein n=1 Tax=Actinomadura kijaniata TaxID=46161 RepID=UPI003F1DF63A